MNIDLDNEEQLADLYVKMQPAGSGPLGMMRIMCALIEAIAKERGYDTNSWLRGKFNE
jgi:hypothetical protein